MIILLFTVAGKRVIVAGCVTVSLVAFFFYHRYFGSTLQSNQTNIMPAVQEFVDAQIQDGKVVVFSKSYCPFCKRAKDTLKKKVKPDALVVIEIENRSDMSQMQDYLQKITGGRSVPRIFVGKKSVGGNDDIQALNSSGKLDTMLKEIGANL